jgi:hypothetical protein
MVGKSANDFFQSISDGLPPEMPSFAEQFSETDRWALTDYIRSLSFSKSYATLLEEQAELVIETTTSADDSVTDSKPPTQEVAEVTTVEGIQPIGSITGSVINSSGGEIPIGAEVTLYAFDNMQTVLTDTTTLKEDGSYSFQAVEMPVDRIFVTVIDIGDATYGSEVFSIEDDIDSINLPIEIYETTTDSSVLSIDRLHYFFEFIDANTLSVVELYVMSNTSSQTLVANEEGKATVEFEIPPEATNLVIQDEMSGGRYVRTENGFGDMVAIRPGLGIYQVMFSYELPFDRKLDFFRPVDFTTDALVILVPEDAIKVSSSQIQDAGTRSVQGMQYQMYNGTRFNPGDEMQLTIYRDQIGSFFSLVNISNASLIVGGSALGLILIFSTLGLVLVIAGIILFKRKQTLKEQKPEYEDSSSLSNQALKDDPETIMDAILVLDDLFEDGELPEEAYLKRRTELKTQLKEALEKNESRSETSNN